VAEIETMSSFELTEWMAYFILEDERMRDERLKQRALSGVR